MRKREQSSEAENKNKEWEKREGLLTQMVDFPTLFISSLEEHSYTCFVRMGCRAPHRYSPANGPSVHTWDNPEMADHLGTRWSSPSTIFNRIMMEAKYLSAPARSSTSHCSRMVYPRSRLLEFHLALLCCASSGSTPHRRRDASQLWSQ
ncbi:hypothetical protein BHE74_00033065 [Ensete ventricosum]|nr:hypothetical protein GW17_00056602 [Ensete ventricosum]RWW59964.1 hypothetical protein BHE74_00033065 [Ensete ventricosum]RZS28376.1 hypothetical protein BHM03_00061962 [Ensete ventricosum]